MSAIVNKLLKLVFGDKTEKELKAITPIIEEVNKNFDLYKNLSAQELRTKSAELKQYIADYVKEEEALIIKLKEQAEALPADKLSEKESLYKEVDNTIKKVDEKIEEALATILPQAFAVMKATAKFFTENATITVIASDLDRELAVNNDYVTINGEEAQWSNAWDAAGSIVTWNMVHYDVQLIGGYALHSGKVAEMQTGEGKTLVATLPVFLNALAGKGVHVVTVNDYLAKRDSEWMGPIFEFHGLRIDCIDKHQPNSDARRNAYKADITYGTNNEFGFDYLRDNMASDPQSMVQRKHHYAIVDEVDSVLIDDARTPLIISGPTPKGDEQLFEPLKPKVVTLFNAQKQMVTGLLAEAKKLLVDLESPSKDKKDIEEGGVKLFRAYRGLPKNKAIIKFLSEPGVKAVLQKTENFYISEQGKHMHKIDDELFFVIDEKQNSVDLTTKGAELISGSDNPDFFILPDVSSAIGAIESAAIEDTEKLKQKDTLMQDYSVKAERIHTVNQLLKAYCLFEKDVDYVVMDAKVKIVDEQTGRIMDGRRYSDGLHQAIEAKESVTIESATQTYASVTLQNYFRMYHKLSGMTGTAETEATELYDIYKLDVMVIPTNRPVVRRDEEDMVFKTKREKYNAIIEEIIKLQEAGRPVLVGTTSVEVSELLGKALTLRKIKHNVLNAKLHQREADIVAEAGKAGTVTIATNMAGRGTDIKLSEEIKANGGLAILGSEKHDSRRVDRQLRGRSGRQGDPGSSQFYISLEDDLMRLFGSDRVAKIMDRLGLEEGEVIQHSLITRSIERAQKKVEENNFGIRKRLLEYDDVMNNQREVIYKKRRHALFGERLKLDITNMFHDIALLLAQSFVPQRDFEGLKLETLRILACDLPFSEDEFASLNSNDVAHKLFEKSLLTYKQKCAQLCEMVMPVVKDVYEKQGEKFTNIAIPFTDGRKGIQLPVNLKKAYESGGQEVINTLEKTINLIVIDDNWKEHLRELDELKQSVQGAVYEQKDPLLIYKFESFELFKTMIQTINESVVSFLSRAIVAVNQEPKAVNAPVQRKQQRTVEQKADAPQYVSSSSANAQANTQTAPPVQSPAVAEDKIGRNDPCPCGSGKKYKSCHG